MSRKLTREQKDAHNRRNRKWKVKDKEHALAIGRASYHRNKHKPENKAKMKARNKIRHLWRAFKITPEEWETLFESQTRCCFVCHTDKPGSKKGWHLDHDKISGKIRNILCHHCNVALGQAQHSPIRLRALADYIEKHNASS